MYGAILGDMVGAPYEFDRGNKSKRFDFWNRDAQFTDDTVMTVAVANALMHSDNSEADIKRKCVSEMQAFGHKFPRAGYGARFNSWLHSVYPEPYNSFGNGSAMRVSAVGWLYDDLKTTRAVARWTAEVTHNHPEGIKGAEATAAAIWLARTTKDKEYIRKYIVNEIGYDLSRTCDEIRPAYRHVESCQQTVPEAITAFLEGDSFEDAIRTAVSLGGDCDTLTCITGGIAEAFWGIPEEMKREVRRRLHSDLLDVVNNFDSVMQARQAK